MGQPKTPDILCFCHLRWSFVFQRPQHLLSRWSRAHRVFFVEEPVGGSAADALAIRDDDPSGVLVATPHLRDGLSSADALASVRAMLSRLVETYAIGPDAIAWYYTPMALAYSEHLACGTTVYDCMDELSAFQGAPAELKELERRLLARADVVFTGGQSLYEAKRESHPNVHAMPSAVDVDHFAKARSVTAEAADQAQIPHPRLGFFGVLDERLDSPLLEAVARLRPDWQIVLVGPTVKVDPATLPRLPNVHYLGQETYDELPVYLAGWDVALLPFARNEATRFISPTKTPEYLAGGKPVVSTSIRDVIRPYGELGMVAIADRPDDFVAAVERALAEGTGAGLARADAFLAERTWDVTWRKMADLVEQAGQPGNARRRPTSRQGGRPAFDALVVGAGFAGSVAAERLAAAGKRVLLVDKRDHLGGNAYDHRDQAGVLVHRYGPHIFHTNSPDVFAYLSRFTDWRPYEHRVLASVDGKLLPIPINLDTINRLYGWNLDPTGVEEFFRRVAEPRATVKTSEDVIVSKVGRELYEKFFKYYTLKQWGLDPSQLDATVIARIPVRTDHDDRYFTDKFQFMPADGYTALFERMVAHPNITVELGVDYRELLDRISYERTIYSGPVDAYFDYCFGKLPYRSLDFKFETHAQERFQPQAVINYPNEHDYTRITEFKYLTGQASPYTTVVYEFPRADGDPYYPVPRPENAALYARYQALAEATPNVHFVGRLATYKYYNMDQVTAQALTLAAKLTGQSRGKMLGEAAPRTAPQPVPRPVPREPAPRPALAASPRPAPQPAQPIELWAGIECTVNRVGDRFFDQVGRSGHHDRPGDIDRFAALGIQALRYPILWETVAPDGMASADFSRADRALTALRKHGVRVIAGLVHHGSGPASTDLLASSFADGLAAYARACAERYPWVEDWTPVNEPLTTARFSALYGLWYPHRRDLAAFARALVTECRAIALAMRAIREVIPGARLVQTEDLGTIYATVPLQYQADYENERRWLSLDLLCGRVRPGTLGWDILRAGVDAATLEQFLAEPCVPDIVGINHYVTSDRFLDHRRERYPLRTWGGNDRQAYADIEAVRSPEAPPPDVAVPLTAAAERFGLPVALTECHLASTREEQMRWLLHGWQAAHEVKGRGHDVRAVTVWALNGAYDWDSLVTADRGHYEPGAFDLRAVPPRSTALAWLVRELAHVPAPTVEHPVLGLPGWWQRPERIPTSENPARHRSSASTGPAGRRPLLIAGGGVLGQAFARACEIRGLPFRSIARATLDIGNAARLAAVLDDVRPWAVINTSALLGVDEAELRPDTAYLEYAVGPMCLAQACSERRIGLITFSSDLVFDGAQRRPYVESDMAGPLNVFGRSKLAAERRVLAEYPSALVIRTSTLFGPWDQVNFVVALLRAWQQGQRVRVPSDRVVSPTYLPDLVRACLDFLIDGEHGIWHLANGGEVTPAEFAWQIAAAAGAEPYLEECVSAELALAAPRPAYSVLGSERGEVMPPLEESIERFFAESEYRSFRGTGNAA